MSKKKLYILSGLVSVFVIMSSFSSSHFFQDKVSPWEAPASANSLKSPSPFTEEYIAKGEELYNLYCLACHGETGLGDGPAGTPLVIKPANFHTERVIKQSNGSLFWKISQGRGNMPAFKEVLKEEERWQVLAYVRKLSTQD